METREGYFSGQGGVDLFYRGWVPAKAQGVVVIFHGFGEHSGRYQNVVDKLTQGGFAVFAYDLRGHGQSQGIRTHINSFDDYINDAHRFVNGVVKPTASDKPLFLLSNSMGSIIAMHYIPLYGEGLRGCILAGIGAYSPVGSPLLRMTARVASRVLPQMRVDFPLKSCFISRDWEVVQRYDNDPLVEKTLSCRLGEQINTYLSEILLQAAKVRLPVLIQFGEKDESFTGADTLCEAFASPDKTLKLYKGCKHEVYNELPEEREEALQDLLNWLKERV